MFSRKIEISVNIQPNFNILSWRQWSVTSSLLESNTEKSYNDKKYILNFVYIKNIYILKIFTKCLTYINMMINVKVSSHRTFKWKISQNNELNTTVVSTSQKKLFWEWKILEFDNTRTWPSQGIRNGFPENGV